MPLTCSEADICRSSLFFGNGDIVKSRATIEAYTKVHLDELYDTLDSSDWRIERDDRRWVTEPSVLVQ